MSEHCADIPSTGQIRDLSKEQLNELAAKIRKRLIEVTSINGGHLASSLGAVELILALHHVFDFPKDKLVFDVGHQSYTHKLLTDRQDVFDTLRTYGGICGFTRREESMYDVHDSGHASDSLSVALGLAISRDLNGGDERVAALIGDASISGGMAFEALNHIGYLGTNMTIVLNDNDMSISRNVGALSLHLGKARISKPYTKLRDTVEGKISKAGRVGRFLVDAGEAAKSSFKKLVVPGTFFEDIGIVYIGPIDGHNVELVCEALRVAGKATGPVLIHVVTQKGRGFAPAEMQPDVFHGVSGYDPDTGRFNVKADKAATYTDVFSKALVKESETNDNIVALTAAMPDGTGLTAFKDVHPKRFFDVGIAEEHAVTLASGLAIGGKLPIVAIYSTFLQRAYDQIAINVALQNLHVVFCVDRGGLVGEDGTTHHGVFDLTYLRSLPNMKILAPADAQQLRDALHTAIKTTDGPIALRYPRGEAQNVIMPLGSEADGLNPIGQPPEQILPIGKAVKIREGSSVSILAIGRMVENAYKAASILSENGIEAAVYNMLWVKPIDEDAVLEAAKTGFVVTVEEGTVVGGFGSAVLEVLAARTGKAGGAEATMPRVLNIGIEDKFVSHGSIEQLLDEQGLTAKKLAGRITDALRQEDQTF